ncbi:transcription elongation factor SPT6-like [Babylonia areolata]|uniref:transcription elongation factor SPT6-like n=1 Tax=Babylonia areolata TaxID=304850 RepID=UPI003FD177D9
MADFVENEAEESDMSSEEMSGSDIEAEAMPIKKKKEKKKKARARIEDDDEDDDEEEEDPSAIDEEMKGFIINNDEVDEEEEEGDDSGEEDDDGKRKRDDDDDELDDRLEDDDYDLLEENLGVKVSRKHQRKRIRVMSDEGSDDEESAAEIDGKQAIKETLFDDDDDAGEDVSATPARERDAEERNEFGDLDEEEESDIDDFIVDDEGRPISKGKKKKHIIHSDKALQEAQDIFGVDFNYEEFEGYSDGEEDFDDEYEDDEIGEDGEPRARAKKQKKRATKKSIFDVFEPSELERGHFTETDNEIRTTDVPERFQLRQIPLVSTAEHELEEEADWIYKQAFATPTITAQSYIDQDQTAQYNYSGRRGTSMINKIKEAINFMRNQRLEVPFIAFYRKEYVEPELNIRDLWKIYHWDEKWTQLTTRRKNLTRLFEKMQMYLGELLGSETEGLGRNIRPLTEQDMDRVKNVQTMEEMRDVYQHFLLYYGHEIPAMRNAEKKRRAEELAEKAPGEEANAEPEPRENLTKQATRRSGYSICLNAKLDDIARQFGLKPSEVGENLRDNYQRHDVQQCPVEPGELAKDYVCPQFNSEQDVLEAVRYMVALQISHDPLVRQAVRQTYYERAKLKVQPTKKGLKMIDEGHACYPMKYMRNKPVKDLKDEQFLKLVQAETDGLVEISVSIDEEEPSANTTSYFEEVRQLYYRDEFSHLVQQWNIQRSEALKRALEKVLYPQMEKELREKMVAEAKEGILAACSRKLYGWLKIAPYQPEQQLDDDYDDDDISNGVRVLGISYSENKTTCAFGALIDGDGLVSDFVRLPYFTLRRKSPRAMERDWKENDLQKLKEFILNKKPHVIAITAESRTSCMLMDDIKDILAELEQEEQIPPINVELVDNEVAMIFENSTKAQSEFRDYPGPLRHAISIARRIQDPLVEFAQLCNSDEEILCLKYHPMQDIVSKEELLNAINLVFINRVNEVGVDINQCIAFPHTSSLLQFVCGLGPRKASYILKILKQSNSRLENRTQLVQLCHMGPKVFINCAGFIKLDTNSLGDSTDNYVDVLDGSRVHPEAYEWARKMAVDALEYDDTAEDANPAGALEEILESPERLKDLDLDAFAEELERQGYGDKHITLYDIRAELNQRYKDMRVPYRSPTNEERFNMLTKETPETFYVGKMVMTRVVGIAHKRPQGDQLDQANPVRNEDTGLWQCPFCHKNDFPELSEVWSHFDGGNCPGSAVGVRTRLDNGVSGFIHIKNLSDKQVTNPEARVQHGMTIHARIIKIDIDRYQVELTSKTSDLVDADAHWKPQKDLYYDFEYEKSLEDKEQEKKKQQARQTYIKRVIAHPNFRNIAYKECEKAMASMDLGDVVIRPSSKGSDHLTVTWKVADGILQHIDVTEEGKENAFSLGKSLLIGDEEFEDLDEIIARHVQPMASSVRDIIGYRYYRPNGDNREAVDKLLKEDKKKTPSKIPYYLSASIQAPGKFLLSYLPRDTTRHEYFTVTPDGLKYRQQIFSSLNTMLRWFKEHFRDAIPGTPASTRTPAAASAYATPSLSMQRMTPGRSQGRQMYGSVPQATPQAAATPSFSSRGFPGAYGANLHSGFQGPVATPMMTPMMTPSSFVPPGGGHLATPVGGSAATPSYQPTPRNAWPGATPRTPAARTPATRTPALASRTPANLPTPMARTPSRTPLPEVSPAMGKQPTSSSSGASGAGTDWARAAELWAKQRQSELAELGGGTSSPRGSSATPRGTPRGTPRSTPRSKSPRASSSASPAPVASTSYSQYGGGDSPQGDGTPLIDER